MFEDKKIRLYAFMVFLFTAILAGLLVYTLTEVW